MGALTSVADDLRAHALALPEAWADSPWEGDNVAKVRRRIFAFLPTDDHGSLGVKLPTSAGFALTLGAVTPMAYGLGRHGWVTIALGSPTTPDGVLLRDWISESYRAIAPRRLAALLSPAGD